MSTISNKPAILDIEAIYNSDFSFELEFDSDIAKENFFAYCAGNINKNFIISKPKNNTIKILIPKSIINSLYDSDATWYFGRDEEIYITGKIRVEKI